jgi:putative ATPase
MKEIGYGKGYKYAHSYGGHIVEQEHLPEKLKGRSYYHPGDEGFEKEMKERLALWRAELEQRRRTDG